MAGGGDPAAVTAALDERIKAVVPFNFGGPQPESPYPLPADSENTLNYAGSGTGSSRGTCGFLPRRFPPWAIVATIAPRTSFTLTSSLGTGSTIPVWKRLQRIYTDFYGHPDFLDYTTGFGVLQGRPPQASHCNNIGDSTGSESMLP